MQPSQIREIVTLALTEDVGDGDITAQLIPAAEVATAQVISQQSAVFCGKGFVDEVFREIDTKVVIDWRVAEGAYIVKDQVLCEIFGPARSLVTGERAAINFLQTLSSTATLTKQYVDQLQGTNAKLLDTRKTLPGLRKAQKYAVTCGGGCNHRFGLYDAILIKENHIVACGSITDAVGTAFNLYPKKPIEIEVRNLDELQEALLTEKVATIMLDNFTIEELEKAVAINSGKVKLEASGGVNLDNVRLIAETGVDYISVGAITKTVVAIELSMLFL